MTTFSHMPFDSSIVLRDPLPHAEIYTSPFSSKSDQLDPLSWDPRSHPALAQPPTPPLDMNDVQTSSPLEYYPQEHGYYLGNYVPVQHNRRSVLASSSFAESRATALQSEMISHRSPPVRPLAHDKVTQSDMSSHRRQGSHTSSTSTRSTVCASVNYSGENIHELAAQVSRLLDFGCASRLITSLVRLHVSFGLNRSIFCNRLKTPRSHQLRSFSRRMFGLRPNFRNGSTMFYLPLVLRTTSFYLHYCSYTD